ncbi:MAG: hypothetical protein IJ066_04635, partial [Bacteroidaceae bacterium]|nr:hypothetical protein [Bacteroidaceae bacterium]
KPFQQPLFLLDGAKVYKIFEIAKILGTSNTFQRRFQRFPTPSNGRIPIYLIILHLFIYIFNGCFETRCWTVGLLEVFCAKMKMLFQK